MFELARFAARKQRTATATLTLLLALLAATMVAFFPSVEASGVDFEQYIQSLPPAFREAFGVATLTSIEGFLASEFYQFAFVLLFGLYVAYLGGRLVAADVETGRIDLLLATPVSRRRVVVERYLSLVPSLLVTNVVVPAVVVVGVELVGESIALERVVAVHLLSIPYLLCCGAIGLVLSVLTSRTDVAQRSALGLVFALFMLETVGAASGTEALGYLSPTYYYDPTAVLVRGTYDFVGAVVLSLATAALVGVAVWWFSRTDIEG
ncbi:ABC transporter permease subunit [Halospeciosus flavus]|uniref:ABC transporter permease subunit n=1 Tax=Halospeciosus flavus TaxID=3032283 RepID=A0ABD5Z115_9EURY|nr:ABC transporter permease subunit [Halospeciosus flavus]